MTGDDSSWDLEESDREEIVSAVRERNLPDDVQDVTGAYSERIGDRNEFLWRWVHTVLPHIQLSSVDVNADRLTDTKTIVTLLVSLYDDVAEKHDDLETFDSAFPIPFRSGDRDGPSDTEHVAFIDCVWDDIDSRIRRAPRHDEFRRLLEYDLRQVLDSIEYSALVNARPEMANMRESRIHEAHNMTMFVYADIDLMHSRGFDREELGALRRAVWHGQQMARIGNWLSTWRRELHEGDYSSGVVVSALENGVISPAEVRTVEGGDGDISHIEGRIEESDVEQSLLDRWQEERTSLEDLETRISSIDVGTYVDGLETILDFHLATRGLK